MKVLVSDNLGEVGIHMLQHADGIEVDVRTGLKPSELNEIIGDYDALIIRSATQVTEDILSAAHRLKVVGRAGIGLDNVDIQAASKRGVAVMNTPTGNVITTAEHAIAMMLSLARNIPRGTATLKAGKWEKKKLQGIEVFNKVLGLIGFGKIGSIVADRARGLKMQVIVHDPFVTPDRIQKEGFESVTFAELLKRSDFITLHVPKLKETAGFINAAAFAQMKTGVMLINCARGGIVNEADLCDAIRSGKVRGAALDVFEQEPPESSPLMELDNVVCTPHLGASTQEAQANVAVQIAEQVIDFLTNGTVVNAVNVPSVTGDLLVKLRPYLALGDRMGCLMTQLICGPVKAVNIEYLGDFKGIDISPVSTAFLKGMLAPMVKDMVNSINAPFMAKDRGITVTESKSADAEDYINLIRVRAETTEMSCTLAGTVFGKNDPRIVRINHFRLDAIPHGHAALIYNEDKPGAIGSIGTTLGANQINIGRMHVGQEADGKRNIIFLRTDTAIPDHVVAELKALPLVNSVIPLSL